MQTDATPDRSRNAKQALVTHLKENPSDALLPPGTLATRFGLDTEFVANVLSQIHPPEIGARHRPRLSFAWFLKTIQRGEAAFDRMIAHPILFVAITYALLVLCGILASYAHLPMIQREISVANDFSFKLSNALGALSIVFVYALHIACYFRRAMIRYPLYGGLVMWVGFSVVAMTFVWLDLKDKTDVQRSLMLLLVSVAMALVALLYSGTGLLAAVLGGWYKLRQQEIQQERMSRQELLERYFELQSRMEKATTDETPHETWEQWPIIRHIRSSPFLWGFGFSAVMGLCMVLLMYSFNIDPTHAPTHPRLLYALLSLILSIVNFSGFLIITFLAGSPRRAALTSLAASAASLLVDLLPIGHFGIEFVTDERMRYSIPISVAVFAIIGAIMGMGALVQQRASRDASLQRNDEATIVGEMLRIQWQLSNQATEICVMVVDAAKSAMMKQSADPLAVEYSFREYQNWIAEICQKLGGRVHSTAGDGAVVAFDNCVDAFLAAKRIQTDLERFNREDNRLDTPFKLRIGLHTGRVQGDLNKVVYTDVIDIAAHVQGAAPIAGIAVTDEVVARLSPDEFIPLARQIDNHQVLLALNPTED